MLMMWETLCGMEACCMQRKLMMQETMGFVEMIWIKWRPRQRPNEDDHVINQNSFLQDFALPFHDMVLPDPGFEDMHKVTHCCTRLSVGMIMINTKSQ